MGKVSKKKFTQLARLFSGRTKKNFKQLDESTSRDPYVYEDLNDSLHNKGGGSSSSGSGGGGNGGGGGSGSCREDKSKRPNLKF